MEENFRSTCPISSVLDIVGDKWSLLIIRDMMFGEKSTFGEFASSQEHIATSILADRLYRLECNSIISKGKLPDDKKKNIYTLTNKGIDLLPMVIEMILWSDKNHDHIAFGMKDLAEKISKNKNNFVKNYAIRLKKRLLQD